MATSTGNSEFVPKTYTMHERMELFKANQGLYTKIFSDEAKARARRIASRAESLLVLEDYDIFNGFDTEEVYFDNVTLEMNTEPSFYIVDYFLLPIIGPRLELHLRGTTGIHNAKQQMGRIAHYIAARRLDEQFPNISATTFTPLARGAQRVTRMLPALTMYLPDSDDDDADRRFEGAFNSHNHFLRRHGRPMVDQEQASFSSLAVSTTTFLRLWKNDDTDY